MAPAHAKSIPATLDALLAILEDEPILWVGAGTSMAAGYPSTDELCRTMREKCAREGHPVPDGLAFTGVADWYVANRGKSALSQLLHNSLATPRAPTQFHRAVAQLAAARKLRTIITTNYDRLVERALEDASVRHLVQTVDDNLVMIFSS